MFRIASGRWSQDSCDSVPGGYEATRPINLSYQRHKTRSNSLGCVVSGHGDTCARGITMITWVRMSNICTNCLCCGFAWLVTVSIQHIQKQSQIPIGSEIFLLSRARCWPVLYTYLESVFLLLITPVVQLSDQQGKNISPPLDWPRSVQYNKAQR